MSIDPGHLFAALARDTTVQGDPAVLRQLGARRTRVRRTLLAAASAAVIAVVAIGTGLAAGGPSHRPDPPIGGSPGLVSRTPVTPPVQSSAPVPQGCRDDTGTVVPYRAFLQPADGADPSAQCAPAAPEDQLPAPCASMSQASDSAILSRRGIELFLRRTPADTAEVTTPADYGVQTVTVYSGNGAHDYLTEIGDAVARCPSVKRDGRTYRHRILSTGFAGEESVLLSMAYKVTVGGQTLDKTELIAVVRSGDVVTVLFAHGWEFNSSVRSVVDQLARQAAIRVRQWRS